MDDNAKKVHDAVEEVGQGRTSDKKEIVEGLDRLVERFQDMKKRIEADEIGPLGMLIEEFRDIRPNYEFGNVIAKGFNQCGPSVTKITILDYKNAGKTLSRLTKEVPMSQDLTYETIESMKLEPGDLVVVKRDEGSLPIVLEGFMGGLARAYPHNTFAILPPDINLEKVSAKALKTLLEDADEPRTPALAYKIKSNGRCLDTKIIGPDGKQLGLVREMLIEAKFDDPLIRVRLLQIQTDEDGKIFTSVELPMTALNIEVPAEQVEVVSKPLQAEGGDNPLPGSKKD